MATNVALARRREQAAGRIDAALLTLAERYGISVNTNALRGRGKDADVARTTQIEAFADVLEQVVMLAAPDAVPETATPLVIDGVETKHIDALAAAGIVTLDDLRAADDETLLRIKGIGPATLDRIREHLGEPAGEN